MNSWKPWRAVGFLYLLDCGSAQVRSSTTSRSKTIAAERAHAHGVLCWFSFHVGTASGAVPVFSISYMSDTWWRPEQTICNMDLLFELGLGICMAHIFVL